MKKILYDLLSLGPLPFHEYQQRHFQIDPRQPPKKLINELHHPNQATSLIKILNNRN